MTKRTALAGGVVGGLAVVEFTSGVIQGYYTPLFSDIARKLAIHDADINWLEAVQLLLSAIVVPLLARLGDMYGHRRVLLGTRRCPYMSPSRARSGTTMAESRSCTASRQLMSASWMASLRAMSLNRGV